MSNVYDINTRERISSPSTRPKGQESSRRPNYARRRLTALLAAGTFALLAANTLLNGDDEKKPVKTVTLPTEDVRGGDGTLSVAERMSEKLADGGSKVSMYTLNKYMHIEDIPGDGIETDPDDDNLVFGERAVVKLPVDEIKPK